MFMEKEGKGVSYLFQLLQKKEIVRVNLKGSAGFRIVVQKGAAVNNMRERQVRTFRDKLCWSGDHKSLALEAPNGMRDKNETP